VKVAKDAGIRRIETESRPASLRIFGVRGQWPVSGGNRLCANFAGRAARPGGRNL
jgi:hypothetical protein